MKSLNVLEKENEEITGITQFQKPIVSPAFVSAAIIGIVLLIVLIQIGFLNTYIRFFPKFEDTTIEGRGTMRFNWIMHLHGMVMMSWVFMLLVQPILIRQGKMKLHRQAGQLSYVIAPLVVVFLFLVNQDAYHNNLNLAGKFQAVAFISLTFPGIIFFGALYTFAILYRRRPALHMRFMCSTAFLLIPPALDRALIFYLNLPGFDVGSIVVLLLTGTITIIDSVKTKRLSPFVLVFAFFVLHKTLWHLRETDFWQTIGNVIAKLF